VSSKVPLDH